MARKRPNGAGMNPRKRPDGRWEARVFVPLTDGTIKRVSVYGKSPEDVDEKLTKLKAQRDKGIPAPSTSSTVRDFLATWLDDVIGEHRKSTTYDGHEVNVRCHITPFIGGKKLARLSVSDVQRWLAQLRKEGRGDSTIQSARRTLRAALNYAIRAELLSRNVALHVEMPPTDTDNEALALEPAQAKEFVRRAGAERLYAGFVLGMLGLRRGEVLGLRWQDIDFDRRTLTVRQTVTRTRRRGLYVDKPKTRRSRRTLPLPRFVLAALRTQLVFQEAERAAAGDRWRESGHVLTSPIGTILEPRNFHREYVTFRDSIEGMPAVKFHELRHSMISLLTELGVAPRVIMEIAGHAQLDVTMNTYSHVRLEAKQDALDQLGGLFGDDHNDGSPDDENDGDAA